MSGQSIHSIGADTQLRTTNAQNGAAVRAFLGGKGAIHALAMHSGGFQGLGYQQARASQGKGHALAMHTSGQRQAEARHKLRVCHCCSCSIKDARMKSLWCVCLCTLQSQLDAHHTRHTCMSTEARGRLRAFAVSNLLGGPGPGLLPPFARRLTGAVLQMA